MHLTTAKEIWQRDWNKYAISTLKLFHQSYQIKDNNYALILCLTGQLLNSQITNKGYCPYFLHMGSSPRVHNYITFRSLQTMKDESDYAQELVKVQNVIYFINKQQLLARNNKEEKSQLVKFQPGDFVLLKKKSVSAPRNLHKVKTKYHNQVYRILRRTKTNAILAPFQKKFVQQRFKGEGHIPKNLCTMQKLSHLKPVKNVYTLLGLSVTQKLVLELNKIIRMEIPTSNEVEITENIIKKGEPGSLIKRFNPSVRVNGSLDGSENTLNQIKKGINNIKLKTYVNSEDTSILC